ESARRFKDFTYQTLESWSRPRRVIGKAEYLAKGANPRFIVTSLSKEKYDGRLLYEDTYCARGDMENRIKEQQLMLFADRTSADDMRANQIRLYFSSIAYVLMSAMRRIGLAQTSFERAQCNTIRLKLLKVGALVRITVRKIWISFSQSYPYQEQFLKVLANIRAAPAVVLRC
ncbi:MAG: transposase, partial [Actinomycetota bacterium]|nr:transposase [Actinomycetota bacterium]